MKLYQLLALLFLVFSLVLYSRSPLQGKISKQQLFTYEKPVYLTDSIASLPSRGVIYQNKTGQIYESPDQGNVTLASLSKLVCALSTVEEGHLADEVTVGKEYSKESPSLGLPIGSAVKRSDLLSASLIPSANDAAEILCGEGVKRLNEIARGLGLTTITLAEPTGLNTANKGSGKDITLLGSVVLSNPVLAQIVQTKSFTHNGKTFFSTNILLNDQYKGIKTGSLPEVGYHLLSYFEPLNIISVLFSAPSTQERFGQTQKIIGEYRKKVL